VAVEATGKQMMRIGELAKATGITVQTIHFYLREGLLPAPTKTARNMAYYGPEYVEDIRLIKELQRGRYLPLSLIRQLLEAKRQGLPMGELSDMRLGLDWIFGEGGNRQMTVAELVVGTGLPLEVIRRLEGYGLVGGRPPEAGGGQYDELDLRLGRALKVLLDSGLAPDDLEIYARHLALAREEAHLIHDKMLHNRPRNIPRISTEKLRDTVGEINMSLMLRAFMQMAVEVHERHQHDQGNSHDE
jgi:DNA-binding transcriptional MerR regulator